jgi:hypothetical protein
MVADWRPAGLVSCLLNSNPSLLRGRILFGPVDGVNQNAITVPYMGASASLARLLSGFNVAASGNSDRSLLS